MGARSSTWQSNPLLRDRLQDRCLSSAPDFKSSKMCYSPSMEKTCPRCEKTKDVSEFAWKVASKGLRQPYCKSCQKAYQQGWYRKNRVRHKANVAVLNKKRRAEIRNFIVLYLVDHPCIDCGESDPIVLEFDHQYGKRMMISRAWSMSVLKKEIKKCVIRCANCHRRKTAKQMGWSKAHAVAGVTQLAE